MTRTWSRPGRIVLIEDITESDRPRLAPLRPDRTRGELLGLMAACLAGLLLVIVGAVLGMVL